MAMEPLVDNGPGAWATVSVMARDQAIVQAVLSSSWLDRRTTWWRARPSKRSRGYDAIAGRHELRELARSVVAMGGARPSFYDYDTANRWEEFAAAVAASAIVLPFKYELGHFDPTRGRPIWRLEDLHVAPAQHLTHRQWTQAKPTKEIVMDAWQLVRRPAMPETRQ